MVLGQDEVVGGLGELIGELGGQGVLHAVAGHGGLGAQGDEQVGLAGAGVPDQAEWVAALDPFAGGQGVDRGGVHVGVGGEVEVAQRLLAGEAGGLDASFGASAVAVVALGQQQLGQERPVGHLVSRRGRGGVGEVRADRRQSQQAACLVDRRVGGLFGDAAATT